jgi:hypothetical protein
MVAQAWFSESLAIHRQLTLKLTGRNRHSRLRFFLLEDAWLLAYFPWSRSLVSSGSVLMVLLDYARHGFENVVKVVADVLPAFLIDLSSSWMCELVYVFSLNEFFAYRFKFNT